MMAVDGKIVKPLPGTKLSHLKIFSEKFKPSMVVIKRFNSTVSKLPTISSTLILSRNPIITRELPAFEQQYYNYQNELWKRLMWTFPKWYYYRDGTLGDQRFKELNKPPVFNNPKL